MSYLLSSSSICGVALLYVITPGCMERWHHYLFILIDQEVIGAEFKNHQTSEQLKRVFALISLSCLVKVYGEVISTGGDAVSPSSPRLSGTLRPRRDMLAAGAAVDTVLRLCLGR